MRFIYADVLHKNTAFCENHGAHDLLTYISVYKYCHCVSKFKFYLRIIIRTKCKKKIEDALINYMPWTNILGDA